MAETKKTTLDYLLAIQSQVRVGKTQHNAYGGFNYRSAEQILANVNGIIREQGCAIILNDDAVQLGDRYYIKATATLMTPAGDISTTGWARAQETVKGQIAAMISGSCSSYARKYALCGLLSIDDCSQDPDSMDTREEGKHEDKITQSQIKTLEAAAKETGTNIEDVVNHFRPGDKIEDFSTRQYGEALNILNKKRMRQEQGA